VEENGFSIVLSPAQLAAVLSGASLRGNEPPSFWTRAWGGGKLILGVFEEVGAGALFFAPEPTMLTKIGSGVLGVHGADTIQSGARQFRTGRDTPTFTQQGATATARGLGAKPAPAEAIGVGIDTAVPIVVSFGLGAARIIAVRSGRIVLAEHEALAGSRLGGHTIAKHIGRTDAELIDRLQKTPGMRAASTFANLREAETLVSRVLRFNRVGVKRWLALSKVGEKLELDLALSGGVGRVMVPGATKAISGRVVRVVLRKQVYAGKSYYVLTAFPKV